MGRFLYTVQDSKGDTASGSVEAGDENEAINALQSKGYFILSIQAEKEGGGGGAIGRISGGGASGAGTSPSSANSSRPCSMEECLWFAP